MRFLNYTNIRANYLVQYAYQELLTYTVAQLQTLSKDILTLQEWDNGNFFDCF